MNRRERKKQQTRDSIIDCGVEFFKNKGFSETSMEEIAEKADISKGSLYNYFQDKESILAGYFQKVFADYAKEMSIKVKDHPDFRQQLENLLDFLNLFFKDNTDLVAIYLRYRTQSMFRSNPFDNPYRSGLEKLTLDIFKEAQEANELRKDLSLEILARNFQFLYVIFFISNLYGQTALEAQDFNSQLIELFLNGAKK